MNRILFPWALGLVAIGMLQAGSVTVGYAASDTLVGVVVSADVNQLVLHADNGESHSFVVDQTVIITVNGKPGQLKDLVKGLRVRVMTDKSGKVLTIATLDGHKDKPITAGVGFRAMPWMNEMA